MMSNQRQRFLAFLLLPSFEVTTIIFILHFCSFFSCLLSFEFSSSSFQTVKSPLVSVIVIMTMIAV